MTNPVTAAWKRLQRRWLRQSQLEQARWAERVLREQAIQKALLAAEPEIRYRAVR